MHFTWLDTKDIKEFKSVLIDVQENYRKIAEEFCKYYYTNYDSNFMELKDIYSDNSCFTYLDEEIIGFNSLVSKLGIMNIHKFDHKSINVNAQPVGKTSLLILTTGTISVNNSIHVNKFSESILLQRNNDNKFVVYNTIFKLTE